MQLFLKRQVDNQWSLFLALQFIVYMKTYKFERTRLLDLFYKYFQYQINFEFTKPRFFIGLIDINFAKTLLKDHDECSPEALIGIAVVIILLVIVIMFIYLLSKMVYKVEWKNKLLSFINRIKTSLVWNGVIRMLSIYYLIITFQLFHLVRKSYYWIIGFFLLLVYTIVPTVHLLTNFGKIGEVDFEKKYWNFYKRLSVRRGKLPMLF